MNLDIKGKKVLVTGGSHGIGLAIKKELKAEGCKVYSVSRGEGFDVLNTTDIVRVIDHFTENGHLEIDILINNVGGGGRWGTPIPHEAYYKVWDDVYKKNAKVAYLLTMDALPYMMGQNWGRVITIASVYGKEGGGRPWFTMAKAAEIALMKTLALQPEYQEHNITFNSIAPGPIWIEGKEQDKYERYGQPEDVAGIVAFLCSDRARWINGACITVDGGFSRSF